LYYTHATGYHRLAGDDGIDTFYVGTMENMVIWTRDRATGSTRGIVLPNARSRVDDSEAKAMRFVKSLVYSQAILSEELGLLWLCLADMLHWTNIKLKTQHDIVRQIEYATGHGHATYLKTGPPKYTIDLAALTGPTPSYTELSVTMGKSALDTADVKRRYEFMRKVCDDLLSKDGSTAGFSDQSAVRLVRSRVEAQFLRAEYIAERARIQISVVSIYQTFLPKRESSVYALSEHL
jgi:hypothetical protein